MMTRRRAWIILIVILALAYTVLVGSWWIEGNNNFYQPTSQL